MNSRSYAPLHAAAENPASTAATGRRTRAATVLVTTVGAAVIGSAIAAPAADAKNVYQVWDRVAACESSQNWHINTGNGFYGGLQFSASTWTGYHGGKYASRADRATRLQQIEVARRVLASQGPGAWPVCGPRAGLTRSSGHATHASLPRIAGQSAVSHTAKRHVVKKHVVKKHSVKHATKHKSRLHKTYRVHSGDTLAKIARRLHVAGGWHALFRANRAHMSNPNVLRVGQVLRLP